MMAKPGRDRGASSAQRTQATHIPIDGPENKPVEESKESSTEKMSSEWPEEKTTQVKKETIPQDQAPLDADGVEEPLHDEEPSNDERVKKAESEMAEWRDKFMRLHAEWDTYRRRTAEQRTEERATATEKLVESLLPVIDDFERTIEYAEKNGEKGLLDGVQAVQAKLIDTLIKEGVKVLDPKDDAFDALECQAISSTEDATVPDETVTEVFQKGYKMGKKVIRPAMVKVATGGPKRQEEQDKEN